METPGVCWQEAWTLRPTWFCNLTVDLSLVTLDTLLASLASVPHIQRWEGGQLPLANVGPGGPSKNEFWFFHNFPWPFPHKGDLGPLAVEQGDIAGREVSILKQGARLQAALPQLLKALT